MTSNFEDDLQFEVVFNLNQSHKKTRYHAKISAIVFGFFLVFHFFTFIEFLKFLIYIWRIHLNLQWKSSKLSPDFFPWKWNQIRTWILLEWTWPVEPEVSSSLSILHCLPGSLLSTKFRWINNLCFHLCNKDCTKYWLICC